MLRRTLFVPQLQRAPTQFSKEIDLGQGGRMHIHRGFSPVAGVSFFEDGIPDRRHTETALEPRT